MTLTDERIRAALDHRIQAAGLDDPANIPAPHGADLRLAASTRSPGRSRRALPIAIAAAVVVVAGLVAVGGLGSSDHDGSTVTGTAGPSASTSTPPPDGRPALPPPWPKLEVGPETKLDIDPPVGSEEEFLERLPEIDAQGQAQDAETGRMNVIDQLTNERVSVDAEGYQQQSSEVLAWYREHLGTEALTAGEMDPAMVFTDGSFRLIYRSDLDCTPLADGRKPIACLRFGTHETGTSGD